MLPNTSSATNPQKAAAAIGHCQPDAVTVSMCSACGFMLESTGNGFTTSSLTSEPALRTPSTIRPIAATAKNSTMRRRPTSPTYGASSTRVSASSVTGRYGTAWTRSSFIAAMLAKARIEGKFDDQRGNHYFPGAAKS
jgi:hypothetical protein